MISLFVLVTVIITHDRNDVGFRVYLNDKMITETDKKEIKLDIDLEKTSKLEVSAFTATHESERIAVSVGKPLIPSKLQVLK